MKIQKFNESINSKVEIRTIPVEVEIDFVIYFQTTGTDGDLYSIRAILKDDLLEKELGTTGAGTHLGNYATEGEIDDIIDDYINRISKEHRTEKKYNL